MNALWLAYVPQYVVEDLLSHPAESPVGRELRFDVVALFADVSGFTQMSEALGRVGRHGTEELTLLLNGYFGEMIDLVQSYGGIVGKFGGDAMTVLFRYTSELRTPTVRRALQCALDMQALMQHYSAIPTSAGTFSLGMKAGLAVGRVFCTTVGDPAIHLEYIIAGSVLNRCADAEHHARRGEVVVHNDLLPDAGDVLVVEQRDAFSCVAALRSREMPSPLCRIGDLPAHAVSTLAAFVHPAMARRIRAGQASFINEHRKVTALFVNIGEFDYDHDPSVGAALQQYLSAVIRTIHRYDGYLSRVDMGDKGSKCLVLFGAPVIHEDDEARAICCALELRALDALFLERSAATRIGVSSGFMYCGHAGCATRQEYTVMGDAVILAVRLMQAARPGQILVSGSPPRQIVEAFVCESLEPIRVKGCSEPVPLYAVHGNLRQAALRLQEPKYTLPMVGRERELELARAVLDRVVRGHGQILQIVADAGIGKSRLNAEIVKTAAERAFVGYGGACQSYGASTSYLVWRTIWQSFFGIDPSWPPDTQVRHLETQLGAVAPNLAQLLPLLSVVLNSAIDDNEVTSSLDTQLRQDLLKSLLLTCVRQRAGQGRNGSAPLLFVLEDCHWIDPLSQELLEFLGRNIADLPVLVIVVHRPLESRQPLDRITRFAHTNRVDLVELTAGEAERLTCLKLAQRFDIDVERLLCAGEQSFLGSADGSLSQLVELITTRAQGNPFYVEEIVNYMYDRGADPRDARAVQALELPGSLHSLILSRIDRLAEGEQITLKAASVIGRLFKASWLGGSFPQLGPAQAVHQHLDILSALELTPLDKPEPDPEYLFKHITTQEIAYESLAFALRAAMHEQVGRFIERSYPDGLAQHVDQLAYHYGRSGNIDKQRVYFRRAGDTAKAAYANQVAIDYYQRLLALLPESEQGQVQLELGEVWQLIGRWPEAEQAYRRALVLAEMAGDERAQAQCQAVLGYLLAHSKTYPEALAWLERARAGFERLGDPAGMSRVLDYLSYTLVHQGSYAQALACSQQHMRIAAEQGDQVGISAAAANIGLAYWYQEDRDRALLYYQQALDVAAAIGYRRAIIHVGNDMAGLYWSMGDYAQALTCLLRALSAAAEIGYRYLVGMIVGNAGVIYRHQGDYDRALACYAQGLHIVMELGDSIGIRNNITNIAIVYAAQGRCREAERLHLRAIALRRESNTLVGLCEDLYHLADLYARQGEHARALPLNREALDGAVQAGNKEIQFQAHVQSIRLRLALGALDEQAAIGQLEALLATWPEDDQRAAVHYELWRLDKTRETARQAAAEIYRRLYERTPNVEYRRRFEELIADRLPDPPALPALPEVIRNALSLDELLDRIDTGSLEPLNR